MLFIDASCHHFTYSKWIFSEYSASCNSQLVCSTIEMKHKCLMQLSRIANWKNQVAIK